MNPFVIKFDSRLASEEAGFTLIELLVVLVVLGILLAIAIASLGGFRERASNTTAESNVRSALPAIEAYYADNDTYVGMDLTALRAIDAGIALTNVGAVTATTYCVDATVGGKSWRKTGPGVTIAAGLCP